MSSFQTALRHLEDAASVPIVPGDLGSWCRGIQALSPEFERAWVRQRADHERVFEQIARDDPALRRRVKLMRDRQNQRVAEFDSLRFALSVLRRAEGEPHGSWEPTRRGRDLRRELLEFTLGCRALDREVSSWLVESLYRDRGLGD